MQNLNEHINNPIEMCEKTFSHEDLVCFLENGNVIEKQYAALNLDEIRDEHEARLFITNLVGVDGKIREVVAFRIKFFLEKNADLFLCKENFDYFKNDLEKHKKLVDRIREVLPLDFQIQKWKSLEL